MIGNRHVPGVIAALMALVCAACICAVGFSGKIAQSGVTMEYESVLFDTSEVLNINIIMDEADWQDMLEHALEETYYTCDVTLGGQTFYRVGIRPKGNTSLSSIANDPTTDRYSFKLEFDHFVDGQSCFGLDKLILNNNYADATNMKEALVYDMFQYLGADASLYNYAKVCVNGEYWGVYLALEAVEDSFLLRNYGVQSGKLYKPDAMDMAGGQSGMPQMPEGFEPPEDFEIPEGFELPEGFEMLDGREMPDGFPGGESAPASDGEDPPEMQESAPQENGAPQRPDFKPADAPTAEDGAQDSNPSEHGAHTGGEVRDFPGGPGGSFDGGFGAGSGGANLNYTDDALESYQTIWDGAITKTKKADRRRVVTALQNIAAGTKLEEAMDTENLLRYAAVHIFSVNDDSLSGSMAHNYYLYESGGRLNLLPWDYNLAFGGMGGSDATSVVNRAIDDAWNATEFFDALLEDESYHSQYYECLRALAEDYIEGGAFDAFYTRVRSQIDTLVDSDPTAFYSFEEYQAAAETLYQLVKLRGQSVLAQLSGSIAASAEARQETDALIDASGLELTAMGSMHADGGRGFDAHSASPRRANRPDARASEGAQAADAASAQPTDSRKPEST